ncbi:MAG: DNA repair protein RadC [Sphingobacteriaceae bacterium]|nr:DNA repair protein RadC [Sphingobacteriaceae bacterium]
MENNLKHINLKSLSEDDRPREKLMQMGRQHLSDAELLAIILGSGNTDETAIQLAQRILHESKNDINTLAKLSLNELQKFKGVGPAKAINIAAAFELGRRRKDTDVVEQPKITSSRDVFNLLNPKLADLPHEEFWMVLMNRANKVIKIESISKGGISGTVVDVRLVSKSAIENNTSSVILAHNHPSGNLKPSQEDISITKKIKEALKLFDITLFDHLIIGDQNYYSFTDEGAL